MSSKLFEVRSVRPTDGEAWLRMRSALWQGEIEEHAREIEKYFDGKLREPLEVLLAFDADGHAVGFAELNIRNHVDHCWTDRVGYLEGWYVSPEARRHGAGRALVEAAEHWARAQGCTEFASDVLIDHEESAAAHRALGFMETAQIRCFRKDL